MDQQVEHVARAFYDAQDVAFIWESEPEAVRDEFRQYAREAIALLQQHHAARIRQDEDGPALSTAA